MGGGGGGWNWNGKKKPTKKEVKAIFFFYLTCEFYCLYGGSSVDQWCYACPALSDCGSIPVSEPLDSFTEQTNSYLVTTLCYH